MKVTISNDELYPWYYLTTLSGPEYEISEDQLNRWKRVIAEFDVVQDEMREMKEKGVKI